MLLPNTIVQEEAATEISGERRSSRRYSLDLPIQFKTGRSRYGAGRTLDINSQGIAFSSREILQPETRVAMSIDWPLRLGKTCPLQLVVVGKVIRSDEHATAIAIKHHEFRTLGNSGAFDQVVGGRGQPRRALSITTSA